MMEYILGFISNLKILYLVLIILIMVVINIILNKKKVFVNYRYFINGISLVILALITSYFTDVIDGIFKFKFLSIKLYIIMLIITNIIALITINRSLKLIYKVINFILFGLESIFLLGSLIIIVGNKFDLFSSSISDYVVILIDISIIIFIIYLALVSIIYIIRSLFFDDKIIKDDLSKEKIVIEDVKISNKASDNYEYGLKKKVLSDSDLLSDEELLSMDNKELFCISGVECGIIFEDSIPENIVKNYHILVNDINAKMVNGYTLEENKLLKNICSKLKINTLEHIDINNLSILNKITVEEYNFLKQIYEE